MKQGFAHLILIFLTFVAIGFIAFLMIRPTDYESCMKFPGSIGYTSIPPTCNWFFGSFTRQIDTPDANKTTDTLLKKSELNTDNWKTYTNEEYGFKIKFPPDWSFDESNKNGQQVFTSLQFVPVPEGEPWGDSFIGYINIHKNIQDFDNWFNQEAKFGSSETQELIDTANDILGDGFISIEDFKSKYEYSTIDNAPTIVQTVENIKCVGKDPTCYFLGGPRGYEKDWFIYKDNQVFEIGVLTYKGPVGNLDQIISTFQFIQKSSLDLLKRDDLRNIDMQQMLTAIQQHDVDNSNNSVSSILLKNKTCIGTSDKCLDLTTYLLPKYLINIPIDPLTGNSNNIGYTIHINENNKIELNAIGEVEPLITVEK